MKKRNLWIFILAFLLFGWESHAATPPNILFIVSEDNGPEIGCYGAPVKTPSIDKLAQEGVRFQHAYVPQAGCSQSRAAFLTGLYPHQNGQIGLATWNYHMYSKDTPNLVNDLKKAGYRTGILGKLHVNPESAFAFDWKQISDANFQRKELDQYADLASEFINASSDPFYLQVNYPDAHRPFISQVGGLPKQVLEGKDVEPLSYMGLNSAKLKEETANYYNCMMRLDALIGDLLAKLKASGKYDNTVIVYIGDHGADLLRGKRTCYEGGLRIPMIIAWPSRGKKNVVYQELTCTIDLYPTFMALSGNAIPDHLPGKSLVPVLEGKLEPVREYLFAEYHVHSNHNPFPQRTVRDERYKLIHNLVAGHENPGYEFTINHFDFGDIRQTIQSAPEQIREAYERMKSPPEFELYDLKDDPYEWNNLAKNPEYQHILDNLKQVLYDWQVETKDPLIDKKIAERLFTDIMETDLKKVDIPYQDYMDPELFERK
jgi:N-sulfoglucosamine sulfohydrolase